MKILSIDQARHGGWAIYEYESKKLLKYGDFNFTANDFYTDSVNIKNYINDLMDKEEIAAVFIEDIQMQNNVKTYKNLAALQGILIADFIEKDMLYDVTPPSVWQNYCNARGRSGKEIKSKSSEPTRGSKELTINFVDKTFGIKLENDNVADAISIGYYIVNNIEIITG